ncbi:MAG: septum formation initiator family protein [Bacteroidetes bacterium]|nr:septum formation initiator family protein [Bacteroidota bacterium]MCK6612552.1 septum formation initiator family protein [Bacteroidia bacterium]
MFFRFKEIVSNRYFLATLAFVLLLVFNDRYSILDQYRYNRELDHAQETHSWYQSEIERLAKEKEELFGDQKKLEKFAREKYLMKRDSEDVFVFERKSEKE